MVTGCQAEKATLHGTHPLVVVCSTGKRKQKEKVTVWKRTLPCPPHAARSAKKTKNTVRVCVRVFFPFTRVFWTSSLLDVPAGVAQEEGHTEFLIQLPSAVHAFIFLARKIQPFLSLVDRSRILQFNRFPLVGHFFFFFLVRKNPSYRDSNSRPNVSEGYCTRLPTELPGRPTTKKENEKITRRASRDASTCLGATQVLVRLTPTHRSIVSYLVYPQTS